jgi:peptidase YpeB-like protein
MRRKRMLVVVGALAVVLAIGAGAAIARTVGGSDEHVTGPAAAKAAAAAVEAAGGGQAVEVEYQDGDGTGVYEVEVRRPDGTQLEVHLNGQFEAVGTAADDDSGAESEGADD